MIYRNDSDALAYRDRELTCGDDEDDYEVEECHICGDRIRTGEECYEIHGRYICDFCYNVSAERIVL